MTVFESIWHCKACAISESDKFHKFCRIVERYCGSFGQLLRWFSMNAINDGQLPEEKMIQTYRVCVYTYISVDMHMNVSTGQKGSSQGVI